MNQIKFQDLPFKQELHKALAEMGLIHPTEIQHAVWDIATQGKDVVLQSQTGTGKTLAFGLPILQTIKEKGFQVLVLEPTRELALQVKEQLSKAAKHLPLRVCTLYGGVSIDAQKKELEQGTEICVGTPGRVLDHLNQRTLDPSKLTFLVLDEADEMLSMGFQKDIFDIIGRLPKSRQTMLSSATFEGSVRNLCNTIMRDPSFILMGAGEPLNTISHYYCSVQQTQKISTLLSLLEMEQPKSCIVFCNTKAETEQLTAALRLAGKEADWLNGDLTQKEREDVLGRTRSETLPLLVATDIAARGLDISHITHVIHYDFPDNVESYVHRSGRTGRAKKLGKAIALVTPQDTGLLYYLRLQTSIVLKEIPVPSSQDKLAQKEQAQLDALLERMQQSKLKAGSKSLSKRLLTSVEREAMVAFLLEQYEMSQLNVV